MLNLRASLRAIALLFGCLSLARGSGHGPVFGMTTPTNIKGGWSIDLGLMGQLGERNTGVMSRAMLGYGITQDLQLSVSAPYIFSSVPMIPARMSAMMPGSADLEALSSYRFHRQGTGVGTRVESTAYIGLIVPGPQRPAGMMGELRRAPGLYTGVASGMASRSHYLWGGVGNVRYAERRGDQRSNVVTYSAVWGYRPPAWQKEYPHWDWRLFLEATGDKAGTMRRAGSVMPGTGGHQVFVGPTTLGIYKNYAIEGGVQWPVYRDVGPMMQQERFRFALNFSYFF
jgi:hypothetical protein